MSKLKQILPLLPESIRDSYLKKKYEKQLTDWEAQGKPLPTPHIVKQLTINSYRKKHDINIFVETGTYMGDMVYAQRNNFKQLFTIELSEELYKRSVNRLKKYTNIKLIQGDSGVMLGSILPEIKERAIFWLDGHYSGGITAKGDSDCPVIAEMSLILNTKIEHIVLIDDAREFSNNVGDYPEIEEVMTLIKEKGYSNSTLNIKDDIICIELKF